MRPQGLNLTAWLRRLFGAQSVTEPEILGAIQPVVILGDHRGLLSPLYVAESHGQGYRTTIGINRTVGFSVHSLAPGGTRVRLWCGVEANNAGTLVQGETYCQYAFEAADMVFTDATLPALQQLYPDRPTRSVIREGRTAAGVRNLALDAFPIFQTDVFFNDASGFVATRSAPQLDLHLPAGRFLWVENYSTDMPVIFNAILNDYEAQPPA